MYKKITLMFAVLLASLGISTYAAVGDVITDGTFYFKIVAEGDVNEVEFAAKPSGTYTISNRLIFTNNYNAPITIDGVTYNIVGIGEGAFRDAQFPTQSFTNLPTSLRYISDYAFQGAKSGTTDDSDSNVRFYAENMVTVSPLAFVDNRIHGAILVGNSSESTIYSQVANTASRIQYNSNNSYAPCINGNTMVAAANAKVLANGSGGWKDANKLTLNSQFTIVGPHAMHGNSAYTQLDLGSVVEIKEYAFKNSVVEQLTLPATLTTVDPTAFEGASAIFSITCNATTPPAGCVFDDAVYDRVRNGEGNAHITVPEEALDAYKADPNWGRFWAAATPTTYTITIAEGIANGSVEADKAEAEEGETVALTVTPAEGYQLKSITVAPETLNLAVEVNENYEFTMPADNVTVTAEFEEIPPVESVITFEAAPANGTVAVYVADEAIESGATVVEGTQVKVVLTPAEGYEVSSFAVTTPDPEVEPAPLPRRADVPITEGEANTFTFAMPAGPVTITASFAESVTTAISDLRADGAVRYIDVNGRVSDKPFNGFNIVVDADGSVSKMMK